MALSGIEGEGTRVNRNAMTSFRQVRAAAPRGRRIAVAGADDPAVLHAVAMAVSEGIVSGGRLCMSRLTRAEAELELEQAGLEPGLSRSMPWAKGVRLVTGSPASRQWLRCAMARPTF